MPSQASTILHKAGFVVFMISLPLELLCKSVDSPDLLTTSPLRLHHSAPSQASDGSSQNPLGLLRLQIIGLNPVMLSSEIGLRTLNVAYGSLELLALLLVNIQNSSYRCINIAFDYQLFFRTIAMEIKVEFSFGFLHFAEHDLPFADSIFSFL
ncbi:hypothetical protein IGI04_033764 [Brassica rapa subsp. trilocularis]|uniref:Uncharacterized protein n=1 Tax=Brassica rapa subsp. trilocularis TaxID=1813537 RepID=A0ABQ7L6T0_BRACM|nr:hypothetical protein IGI04_033764 [Brassica rapa subsp. trilocularis]